MAKKVVLIDDDNTTNLLNKMIIDRSGLVNDVTSFDKAQEALEYFNEYNDFPDDEILVLLDINMPVMNGWDFLNAYCPHLEDCEGKHKQKIVMLTSSIDPSDKKKAGSYSCVNDFVSKPLSPSLLSDLINKFLP